MESSGEPDTKSIDPSVGGLVWVRRRNGSWWPGRIMGLDELSESCLVSPRAGTPVKLLGREDASVDWYNLEKSKRVKAFRCGEYDDCIEKAKASANSNKKAVKYARREDAILHALELESARQSNEHIEVSSKIIVVSGSEENGCLSHSSQENECNMTAEMRTLEVNSNSAQELSQSGISFEDPNHLPAPKVQEKRRKTPNDSEDDGSEGFKRMKGLEELVQPDNGALVDLNISNSLCPKTSENNVNGDLLSLRRKRCQVAHVHEFLKRKNRRRPLTKVLECTAMVSVPVICDEVGLSDSKVYGPESSDLKRSFLNSMVNNSTSDCNGGPCGNATLMNPSELAFESTRLSSKTDIFNKSNLPEEDASDILFDVPFVGEDKHNGAFSPTFVSCSSLKPQVETLPLMNNGFNEFGCTTSTGTLNNNISERIDKGTSKWKLKGKRNSRHLNKVKNRNKYGNKGGFNVSMDGDEPLPSNEKILPFRNSRLALHPKYQTRDLPGRNSWADSNLYDVDIEVKANYKPQHVPLVSLMSKLNGKAIVGHPLTVEVLADGCCNDMLRNLSWELGGEPPTENVQEGGERISAKKLKLRRVCSRGKARNLRKSGMLSKKTRKLSSLTGIQKQKKEESRPVVERQCPPIACIPLKVVFSRLNEAVKVSPRP